MADLNIIYNHYYNNYNNYYTDYILVGTNDEYLN